MNETLMTGTPEQTNQGDATSQTAAGEGTVPETQSTQQQATEGQTTDGQQADGAKTDGEASDADKTGAPEKYEFKAVDGTEVSAEALAEFSEVAKELNLPQDAAQKILDKMAPAMARRQAEAIESVKTQWADSARADKEFGGDKLPENLSVAKKALETFGTTELRTLLNESGLGNHPEVIRFMVRAGKAISEDGFVQGTRAAQTQGDPAKRLFPNQS